MSSIALLTYEADKKFHENNDHIIFRGNYQKKPCLIKSSKLDFNNSAKGQLQHEYEVLQKLDHSAVVKAHAYIEQEDYLILEEIEGEFLNLILEKRMLSVEEGLEIMTQLADCLHYIHTKGFIHKDINPYNILWNNGKIKLINFTIASELPRENTVLVYPKSLEGNLSYISPEQTGRMNRAIDYRSDLYSLGVIFYQMLAHKLPFQSSNAMQLIHQVISKHPTPPNFINGNIPEILSNITMKLLEKKAEDRYLSALGIKKDLENCLEQWRNSHYINNFPLAKSDISLTLHIPEKLFGRDEEVQTLLNAFERISFGKTELMLIKGAAGTGKTMLVHEVHKPMTEKDGYFISGKFDQYQKNVPYYGWLQAFKEFIELILTEDPERFDYWKAKLRCALGNIGKVITNLIPELELIIGEQEDIPELQGEKALTRFNYAFKTFIKAIACQEHPLMIFIDDWQWSDNASLHLLKTLLADKDSQYLLVIAAYRDNEVKMGDALYHTIEHLEKNNITINTIKVQNLQPSHVAQLVTETLKPASNTIELAKLIYLKTQGNAFFVNQFIRNLYEEALLKFNKQNWVWDLEKIKQKNITDNIIELMTQKIQKVDKNTQIVLKLAACVGNRFDLAMLSIIAEKKPKLIHNLLKNALREGLLLPVNTQHRFLTEQKISDIQYQFIHDRVQQAIYSLIQESDKKRLHFRIGKLLLEKIPQAKHEKYIFNIIHHLNYAVSLLNDKNEKLFYTNLYLQASQKAFKNSAYQAALQYATTALELMPVNAWKSNYTLCLAIHKQALQSAFLSRSYKIMNEHIAQIFENTTNVLDKTLAWETQMLSLSAQYRFAESIEVGLTMLEALGYKFPKKPSKLQAAIELTRTGFLLGDMTQEDIVLLTRSNDYTYQVVLHNADKLSSSAYIMNNMNLFLLLASFHIKMAIKQGSNRESNYALYGVILAALGQYDKAYMITQAAIQFHQNIKDTTILASIEYRFNGYIRHWKEPLHSVVQPLMDFYFKCLEMGDVENASYSLILSIMYGYFIGQNISEVEQSILRYYQNLEEINQSITSYGRNMLYQVVLNLQKKASYITKLEGDAYQEHIDIIKHKKANDNLLVGLVYFFKLHLCYLFEEYDNALACAQETETYIESQAGTAWGPLINFYGSLTRIALYKKDKKLLNFVKKNQKSLKNWLDHCPQNQSHRYYLVEAEYHRVLNQIEPAKSLYEQAIYYAKENKYLNDLALAYKLAAKFHLENNEPEIAKLYFSKSYKAYKDWGATAVLEFMETNFAEYIEEVETV